MKIAQISDIHLSDEGEEYRDIPVRKNFLNTLEAVKTQKPDWVILSGDLAADKGEKGAYQWLAKIMEDFPFKVIYMPGNHDDISNLKKFIPVDTPLPEKEYFFHLSFADSMALFLDTSTDQVSPRQLNWLKNQSQGNEGKEILLFTHHPPVLCDCLFMDNKYPLKNHLDVWNVLKEIKNINHIFCGHYHTHKALIQDEKNIYLCPSTMMQLSNTNIDFEIKSFTPGWRMISWDGNKIETKVHWLR